MTVHTRLSVCGIFSSTRVVRSFLSVSLSRWRDIRGIYSVESEGKFLESFVRNWPSIIVICFDFSYLFIYFFLSNDLINATRLENTFITFITQHTSVSHTRNRREYRTSQSRYTQFELGSFHSYVGRNRALD